MPDQTTIRTTVLAICFIFLFVIFIFKKQNRELNWAMFYATLWVAFSLGIVNYICVEYNFWSYSADRNLDLKIPLDLYFIWVVLWGIIPIYFLKGKHTLIIALLLFWLDIILMPELQESGILKLNNNWLIGETVIILLVWLPSYLWAKFYLNNTHLKLRSLFQVLIMSFLLFLIIPFTIKIYTSGTYVLPKFNSYIFQVIFIIAFPALIAVIDLTTKGKGTPFPYDKTSKLVRNGVYAYCKNPIQWSFTLIFIPLAILYNSILLGLGAIISVAYTVGISNRQEKEDMLTRFGNEWAVYKNNIPSWFFQWKPKHMPKGTIYFKEKCNQCEQIKKWFTKQNTINLDIKFSKEFKNHGLLQVTYIDYNGNKYKSIKAIAHALEHINLAYASLGWLMRFPIIFYFLQKIIDTMDFDENSEKCKINKKNKYIG